MQADLNPYAAPSGPADDVLSSPKRLWGIDLISAFWGLSALLLAGLSFDGSSESQSFLLFAPLCAAQCYGLFFRMNFARILILILLGVGFSLDVYLLIKILGVLSGGSLASAMDSAKAELINLLVRTAIGLAMFYYLCRKEVRQAFQRPVAKGP